MREAATVVVGAVVLIALVALFFLWPFVSVPVGYAGVVTLFGNVQQSPLAPGLHTVNPLAHVHKLDVQIQKLEINGDAASKDLQHIATTLAVNFHVDAPSTVRLYSDIGEDYQRRVLDGPSQDSLKGVTSAYTAEELVAKREEVRHAILASLRDKVRALSNATVVVDDVFITNFAFSESFARAIESKQAAEQLALKASRDLDRIKVEAAQRIAQSEAEARAIKIQAEAINSQGGSSYVQLQAIQKWDGKLPGYMLGNTVPFLNVVK